MWKLRGREYRRHTRPPGQSPATGHAGSVSTLVIVPALSGPGRVASPSRGSSQSYSNGVAGDLCSQRGSLGASSLSELIGCISCCEKSPRAWARPCSPGLVSTFKWHHRYLVTQFNHKHGENLSINANYWVII